jgi:hypothetical protein
MARAGQAFIVPSTLLDGSIGRPLVSTLTGQPFAPGELPCTAEPQAWDNDSAREAKYAARVCRKQCPALAECRARRKRLVAENVQISGVMGGVRPRSRGRASSDDTEDETWNGSVVHDATVAAQLSAIGLGKVVGS